MKARKPNSAIVMLLTAAGFAMAQEPAGPFEQTVEVGPADETASTDATSNPDSEELLRQEFERYRQLIEDGVLDEADSVAKRIVELTINLYGPSAEQTSKALTNLAIVQHRNAQYDSAQQNFQGAIDIIEENNDRLSNKLVNPLKGLGAAQLEGGRPDLAAGTFFRAVHVTHVNDGPHNMNQVELLESLAETSYRLGNIKEAKKAHDRIYMLNRRYFASQPLSLVQPLMRRAAWQHRTGYYHDERATYRAIIRIVEEQSGKDDMRLVEPLIRLGTSYYFIDTTGSQIYQHATVTSGEIYFKRANRIVEADDEAHWKVSANAKLALADFYLSQTSFSRAQKLYRETWELLSTDEERLQSRASLLESPVELRYGPLPFYIGKGAEKDATVQNGNLLSGSIKAQFEVNQRGRVRNLEITEAKPAEFTDMRTMVERELRGRLYRPAFTEGVAMSGFRQDFTHTFYYRKIDLDRLQKKVPDAEPEKDAD